MMTDISGLIEQKPGEKVVFLARAHWLVFLGELAQIIFLGFMPLALAILFNAVSPDLLLHTMWRPMLILAASAFYLMLWLFFIVKFIDYFLDVYLVTTDRVLDVAQTGLFSRKASELDLARVQDVTSDVKGVIPTLFGFGDVHIQTAGEKNNFTFENVPKPDAIRKRILELVEADRRRQGDSAASLE